MTAMDIRTLHTLSNTMENSEFVTLALQHDSLTRSITIRQWHEEIGLTGTDTLGTLLLPTLYDLVANEFCRDWRNGNSRDSLLTAWQQFHAHDAGPLPRLYIALVRKDLSTDSLLSLYASLPDTWERGYILYSMSAYRDLRFYQYVTDYLNTYPDSPFASRLHHSRLCCERIEFDYSFPQRLFSTDSLTITYDNYNAHEVIFELYRLPDKMPGRGRVGSAMVKVDSLRITTGTPLIFHRTKVQCRMAPQPYGAYYLYARLPEDTAQLPIDSIYVEQIRYRTLFVSDLLCFAVNEDRLGKVRPWVIVADAHTGGPVQGVKVKRKGWFSRRTNKNGEASFPRYRFWTDNTYRLTYGMDKYHKAYLHYYDDSQRKSSHLTLLPNATVFRPGDTLKLTIIGHERSKYKSYLSGNTKVSVWIYHPGGERKDTTLVLDNNAKATLSLPFADEMRRGMYSIRVLSGNRRHLFTNTDEYCTVRLEDYRLPSFCILFDDSCRHMRKDRLVPLSGKVIRTNGTPVQGAPVAVTIRLMYPSYHHFPADTVRTDKDGRFRFVLPDTLSALIQDVNAMIAGAELTAPDGETRNASLHVSFSSDEQPEPLARHDSVAGVPADSLLWIPADSTTIHGDTLRLRLGVPRACWVYYVASSRSRLRDHQWRQLTPGMHTFTFTLPGEPDDYLDVTFITAGTNGTFVQKNRHFRGTNPQELHIMPATMRDHLKPGNQESWTFHLTDAKGQPAQGAMVLSMTDDALETLSSSRWNEPQLTRWNSPYAKISTPFYNNINDRYSQPMPNNRSRAVFFTPILYEPYRVDSGTLVVVSGMVVDNTGEPCIGVSVEEQGAKNATITDYDGYFCMAVHPDAKLSFSLVGMKPVLCPAGNNIYVVMEEDKQALHEVVTTGFGVVRGIASLKSRNTYSSDENVAYEMDEVEFEEESQTPSQPAETSAVTLRQGDTRLALYLPDLQTDANGDVHVSFRCPPDNTKWLIQAMAWNDHCASDYMQRTLMARRTLMLRLALPRFMRQGDRISLPCDITNTSDSTRQVSVTLQVRHAQTDSLLAAYSADMSLPAASSQTLFFPYQAEHADVIVRAQVRSSEGSSDGEQRLLAVLPLTEPVTEAVPFYLHATDTLLTLSLPDPPVGAMNRNVTLMFCNDPVAYTVDQLPDSVDSTAVTVLQVAHNLYALSLRNRLSKQYPARLSPVNVSPLLDKLSRYQRLGGAFSWLQHDGSSSSFYLTLRVVSLLAELHEMDASDPRIDAHKTRAVAYLDKEVLRREADYRKAHHDSLPDYSQFAQYACVRALCTEKTSDGVSRILAAALDSLYAQLNTSELTSWPVLALTFERAGQHERALRIINGLRRYATIDPAHGMYWNNLPDRWWWYSQADLQATFLLAFSRIDPQPAEVEALRQWLFLNRRATRWGNSSLNAYATFALVADQPGDIPCSLDSASVQYMALPDSTCTYTLHHSAGRPAWGALMASYTAPSDQLAPFASRAIRIERQYERTDHTRSAGTPLVKGETVRVTLRLTTDREMDNVVITDRRPATLEPIELSAYGWQDNALYYREVRNADEVFYVEHLSRGTTVLTYDCYVSATGSTLAGLAHAVSEIAPEFTAHTDATVFVSE